MTADDLADPLDAIPSFNILLSELAAYRSTGSPLHLIHAARALDDVRAEFERGVAGATRSRSATQDIVA